MTRKSSPLIRTRILLLAAIILIPLACNSPEPPPVTRIDAAQPAPPPAAPTPQVEQPPPPSPWCTPDELAKIHMEVSIEREKMGGTIQYIVHNGSDEIIALVCIEISVKNSDGSVALTQTYNLAAYTGQFELAPLRASGLCKANLGFTLKDDQTWTWRLVKARKYGYPQ